MAGGRHYDTSGETDVHYELLEDGGDEAIRVRTPGEHGSAEAEMALVSIRQVQIHLGERATRRRNAPEPDQLDLVRVGPLSFGAETEEDHVALAIVRLRRDQLNRAGFVSLPVARGMYVWSLMRSLTLRRVEG
ncbi:MAG: hypothetical protein IPL61_32810 [Myxococcales bacterium]|nr:hypothetical protein [Myxococcales bacterium]